MSIDFVYILFVIEIYRVTVLARIAKLLEWVREIYRISAILTLLFCANFQRINYVIKYTILCTIFSILQYNRKQQNEIRLSEM